MPVSTEGDRDKMMYVVIVYMYENWHEEFSSRTLKEARDWAEKAINSGCGSANIAILNAQNKELKLMRGN